MFIESLAKTNDQQSRHLEEMSMHIKKLTT